MLERGEVANAWRHERWDSLRLLTPNWQSRLPGYRYGGDGSRRLHDDAGGRRFHRPVRAPIRDARSVSHTNVTSVSRRRRTATAWSPIAASGGARPSCSPAAPATGRRFRRCRSELPASVASVAPMGYRNPDQLDPGGVLVVGASATGVQLADEIRAFGARRDARGRRAHPPAAHVSRPRHPAVDARARRARRALRRASTTSCARGACRRRNSSARRRREPRPERAARPRRAAGRTPRRYRRRQGAVLRFAAQSLRDGGSEDDATARSHRRVRRACRRRRCRRRRASGARRAVDASPRLALDLAAIRTVVWATGFRPDYRWLDVPVLDAKGRMRHDGGVASMRPGMYAMGLPFMRRRKSSFIHGAEDDARDLTAHLAGYLDRLAAARFGGRPGRAVRRTLIGSLAWCACSASARALRSVVSFNPDTNPCALPQLIAGFVLCRARRSPTMRLHRGAGRRRPLQRRGLRHARAGARAARHGGNRAAARHDDRRRRPEEGRQRGGRGHRRKRRARI